MEGARQVPALLRAKAELSDEATVSHNVSYRIGYMSVSELATLQNRACRVYPAQSVAKSSHPGDTIVKVKVEVIQ